MTSDEPGRVPRAVTYARGNQGSDRYRRRPSRGGPTPPPTSPPRGRRGLNRKRFWFFAGVLIVGLVLCVAAFSAVAAGPAYRAGEPPAVVASPPAAAPVTPLTVAPDRPRRTLAPASSRPVASPASAPPMATPPAGAGPVPAGPPRRPDESNPQGPDQQGPGQQGPGGSPAPGGGESDPTYRNCQQARRAGAAPLYRGDPGYSERLDRDGDGVACDRPPGVRTGHGRDSEE